MMPESQMFASPTGEAKEHLCIGHFSWGGGDWPWAHSCEPTLSHTGQCHTISDSGASLLDAKQLTVAEMAD